MGSDLTVVALGAPGSEPGPRVALVAPPWLPVPAPAYGGTEAVVDLLARGLADAGVEVLLCAAQESTCPVPRAPALGAARGIGGRRTVDEIDYAGRAWQAALEWGADVVHDHTLVGPALGRGLGPAVVTTNHGPFTAPARAWYDRFAREVAVVALSRHHARTAQHVPIAAVIHHAVDTDRYRFGDSDGGYACFVGRMSPDKGVDRAIVAARVAGVPLRIAAKISDPDEQAYFDAAVAPLLGGEVEYLGELGTEDEVTLLGGAVCLVNPLRWHEPFGMVMIEALSCGTPVVATPTGSAPELVEHGRTGWIAPTDSALADGVRRAAELSREACRQEVEERFSPARLVAAHRRLYEQVCDPARREAAS